jgi:hypothetical protein
MIIALSGNRERKSAEEIITALQALEPSAVLVMSSHLMMACLKYQELSGTPVFVWSPDRPDSQQHSYRKALKALSVRLVILFGTGRNAACLRKAAEAEGVEVHQEE